jgi:putative mRNA 3-end processing factor
MDPVSHALTDGLMKDAGQIVDLDSNCGIKITTPGEISGLTCATKFILTGRKDIKFPIINISDHMDVNGLIGMTKQCAPSAVITYHPGGNRPLKLAAYLRKNGIYAKALEEINTILEI